MATGKNIRIVAQAGAGKRKRNRNRKNGKRSQRVVVVQARKGPGKNAKRKRARQGRNQGFNSGNGSSMLSNVKGNRPRAKRSSTVEQDEYIGEINGSIAFTTTSYPLNPGQATTFPWLSQEAKLWEKYQFEQLEFYYKTELNQFSAQAVGKVIFSADYDASDPAPATKQQAEDSDPHTDVAPYQTMGLRLDPSELVNGMKGKYVRPGNLPGAADIKMYDGGNLIVSTSGQPGATVIGELHVRYRVKFWVPILDGTSTVPTNNSVSMFQSTASEAAGASTVVANLLAATATTNGLNIVNTAGSMVPPAGNYLLDVSVRTNSTTGAVTRFLFDIHKNAATVFTTALSEPEFEIPVANANDMALSAHVYVTANGTDAFTFPVTATYASGTETNAGTVRWTAI